MVLPADECKITTGRSCFETGIYVYVCVRAHTHIRDKRNSPNVLPMVICEVNMVMRQLSRVFFQMTKKSFLTNDHRKQIECVLFTLQTNTVNMVMRQLSRVFFGHL